MKTNEKSFSVLFTNFRRTKILFLIECYLILNLGNIIYIYIYKVSSKVIDRYLPNSRFQMSLWTKPRQSTFSFSFMVIVGILSHLYFHECLNWKQEGNFIWVFFFTVFCFCYFVRLVYSSLLIFFNIISVVLSRHLFENESW